MATVPGTAYVDKALAARGSEMRLLTTEAAGRCMVTTAARVPGDLVCPPEFPLCSIQVSTNEPLVRVCGACYRVLGSVRSQLEHAAGRVLKLDVLPGMAGKDAGALSEEVSCRNKCGVAYCSKACEDGAWTEHHRWLCAGLHSSSAAGWNEFVEHGRRNHETFAMAAQVLARLVCAFDTARGADGGARGAEELFKEVWAPYSSLCHNDWPTLTAIGEGVPDEDLESYTDVVRRTMIKSVSLLESATRGRAELSEAFPHLTKADVKFLHSRLYDPLLYSRILGAVRLNGIAIEFRNPAREYVQLLASAVDLAGVPEGELDELRGLAEAIVRKREGIKAQEREWRKFSAEDCGSGDDEDGSDGSEDSDGSGESEDSDDDSDSSDEWEPEQFEAGNPTDTQRLFYACQASLGHFKGSGVFPTIAYLNHSCAPSAQVTFHDSASAVVSAIEPIAAGDPVTISYINDTLPLAARQQALSEYLFECACPRCRGESKDRKGKRAAAPGGGSANKKRAS